MRTLLKWTAAAAVILAAALWRGWFDDAVYMVGAAVGMTAALGAALLVRRWRSRGISAEMHPGLPAGLVRVTTAGLVVGALLSTAGWAGAAGAEWSPVGQQYLGPNMPKLLDRCRALEGAGAHGAAAEALTARLAQPISAQWREVAAKALVHHLVGAGRARSAAGDLAAARERYSRAIQSAERYGVSGELPKALREQVDLGLQIEQRLCRLREAGKWQELIVAATQQLQTSRDSGPAIARILFGALVHNGCDESLALCERIDSLSQAEKLAPTCGQDAAAVVDRRKTLEAELADGQHFAGEFAAMRNAGRFDQAASLARMAMAQRPRQQWGHPLDAWLRDVLVEWGGSLSDLAQARARYVEAIEVAQANGLDASLAREKLRSLDAAQAGQGEAARLKGVIAALGAKADKAQGELARLQANFDKLSRDSQKRQDVDVPAVMPKGAHAAVQRISTAEWPIVTADIRVVGADGLELTGLASKDFVATFGPDSPRMVAGFVEPRRRSCPLRVALVIDRSGSMKGEPLDQAKKALRKFIEQLPAGAEVEIFAFDDTVKRLCGPGDGKEAVDRAIDSIEPGGSTALFKAIVAAEQAIAQSPRPGQKGYVVLLTDGRNTVEGGATKEQAAQACRQASLPVYAIGLGGPALDGDSLKQIAGATGGEFLKAEDSSQLCQRFSEAAVRVTDGFYRVAFVAPRAAKDANLSVQIGSGPTALKAAAR